MSARSLTSVPTSIDALPRYEISHRERLDSHFFVMWNLKRWRGSRFRKHAYKDPEVGFYGRELFDICQDETPVGTLPCEDAEIAFLLRISVPKWRELDGREVSPIYNWHKVMCDNGEIRRAHPVITELLLEALDSKRRNAAKNADERMRKRLGTIAAHLSQKVPGGARIAASDERLNEISDWIDAAYPGGSATEKRVREALAELSKGW
ncbi:hypothetical protein [Mangrovicoccus algicola]|uniref:Uncharacterized protein n=1 Tax=Mangrovicoccus algicola TaxID=2771008 RepID=A0A8J6Z4J1_9RHOB|nr:hypothetical protein [Mangrovicoccus algicola]MBE3637479.1 hypothetical protein [Mangrovicoccus algicola]